VRNYADAKRSDTGRFAAFHRAMLGQGILLPPSQFEAWFVSAAHSDQDIDRTLKAVGASLKQI
jgi:glutamate-1-semialdehyde 2,1-aminomutase